jgi:hypothetical protein
MKPTNKIETRTIHPEVLKEIELSTALELLKVAKDLRDGTIPPHDFNMSIFHCGTAHCIAGWVEHRTGKYRDELFMKRNSYGIYLDEDNGYDNYHDGLPKSLYDLFGWHHKSDPKLAADAIERYVYQHSQKPWQVE